MKLTLTLTVLCVLACQLHAQVSFNLSSTPGVGNGPNGTAAADVNGDGKADLISADYYSNTLTVLTNNGSGGFVLSGTYPVGSNPHQVIAADVNSDGKMDLICANSNSGDSTLSVLTNNGSGGFVLSGNYAVGSGPQSVAAADVNGDGKVDLITANWGSSGQGHTLTILTNNGSGGFVLASSPVVGNGSYFVTTADVNGDGKVELICVNRTDSTVSVLTDNGSGGFVLSGTYPVGNGPYFVSTADVNGDGKVDLITANWGGGGGNTLTVLTNNGSGGFGFSSTLTVGSGAICVAAADVNGDGGVDLISANLYNNTLSVLTNNGSGGFVLATTLSVGSAPQWVTAADVNGDGKPDLVSANSGYHTLSVLTNATMFPGLVPIAAPSGLISWWRAEGNANDSIGGNNGTSVNGAAYAAGMVGRGFSFNGINQYVNIPRSSSLNSFSNQLTIEFWMYANPSNLMNTYQGLVTSDYYGIEISNGYGGNIGINWFINTTTGEHLISTVNGGGIPVSRGQWHHVAGTYNGARLQLYIDGLPSGNAQTASGTILPMLTTSFLAIGSDDGRTYCGCTGRYFWGLIDEASIYGRALSSNEIAAIYNAGSAGKCLISNHPPVADASATVPLTISGNGSNAAVVLDGSRSYDPDGDPLLYSWFNNSTNYLTNGIVAVVVLPLGTNYVTLTVSDGLASDSQAITVDVITITEAINRLIADTGNVSDKQSLLATLRAALASIGRGNPISAVNQLHAFQNQVNAQLGPIDPASAQVLIDEAQAIIDAITGGATTPAQVNITPKVNGKSHLKFSAPKGQIYIIEASSDLVNWEKIGVAKDHGDGTFDFDDNQSIQTSARFYRIVVQ